MYTSNFVCHDHQCYAEECGCTRSVCPVHNATFVLFGGELVCLYCEFPDEISDAAVVPESAFLPVAPAADHD